MAQNFFSFGHIDLVWPFCELQYALVPRTSLEQRLQDRATEVARERIRPVSHSMSLEDQWVKGSLSNIQIELLAKEILDGSRRELWRGATNGISIRSKSHPA